MVLQKDDKNSSPCWIALVQRYNFPCQVLKRAEKVTNTGENTLVNDGSSHGLGLNGGLDQLITVGYSIESGNATSIDLSTVDHVQCCGHQVLIVFDSQDLSASLLFSLWD